MYPASFRGENGRIYCCCSSLRVERLAANTLSNKKKKCFIFSVSFIKKIIEASNGIRENIQKCYSVS